MAAKNLIVGAIDFGTANSGWACSFLHEFEKDPTKASVRVWRSGGKLVTEKTPTCVLIKPDGKTIKAFGYDAENVYRQLIDDEEDEGYYYFKRFKMMLNKKLGDKLDRNITIEDEKGQSLVALHVFAIAIRFLVDDMMKNVNDRVMTNKGASDPLGISDVHWVLTVPAIWTDAAKQFMREAAIEAGIPTSNLTIALEPEAASIFCRHLSVDTAVSGGTVAISKMSGGTRYMVLDAGGGTIDITLHEIINADCVKEIQAPSGGGWGGGLVDKAFENLLIDLIGPTVYGIYKRRETEDWLDLCRDFEVKKGDISPDKQGRINMKFPLSFSNTVKKELRKEFLDVIEASKYADDIKLLGDKIRLSASLFKGFFEESINKTVGHIKSLLRDENVGDVKAILMVGGYSESLMLQRAIKEAFPGLDVIIPLEASSTILKGALIYGHSPRAIQERVLKYTYGVEVAEEFKEGIDPEKLSLTTSEGKQCWVFSKHVEKGQVVKCNEPQVEKRYRTTNKFQKRIGFPIFATEQKNPRYTDQCTRVGKVSLEFAEPEEEPGRRVVVTMTFSGTEIVVKAVDLNTGKETSISTNFLG